MGFYPDSIPAKSARATPAGRVRAATAALALAAAFPAGAAALPAFTGGVSPLPAAAKARMTPSVWRPGCPVPLERLRRVVITYRTFGGRARRGIVVVNADIARRTLGAFRRLYADGVPLRRVVPIEAYGGEDFRSIEADNTSAFNCRAATGSSRWSQHAYGRAIDVNPIENPYVSGGRTSHPASVPYLDRARVRPGMAVEGGPLVRAFDAAGLQWGGRWAGTKDYQHFSTGG
ncbi:MAG: M15 family metallopeptidase [Thermoleophilia bacterium]|nr:M15 family metallopeptidase [Thermoleophilia bacterium]